MPIWKSGGISLLPSSRRCCVLRRAHDAALAAEPIKVGFSMAITGAVAQNGKQLLIALELWRDDVNAKGGLLGRPVELVYYDDQSNPSNVPGIYTKLIGDRQSRSVARPLCHQHGGGGDAGDHRNNKITSHAGGQREPPFQLRPLFLD